MDAPTRTLTDMGAAELAAAIGRGEVSPTEAVDAHIAQIESVNPRLNAVVVPLFDDARRRAQQAEGTPPEGRGPLHGVPVTVKECYDVAGTPSTVGVAARRGHRADADAPVVARLRAAGAIVLAKTNVSQMLMFVESDNPVYGVTNNPWNDERSSGGSSGGEAAIVAAHGSALGLGTDIGGSVRIPAHCCGISSLKPTPGRLSVDGTVDVVSDFTISAVPDSGGLLARHVADLRLAFSTLAAPAPASAGAPARARIGVYDDDGYMPASASIVRAVREAAASLAAAGRVVVEFHPPDVPHALDIFYGVFGADGGTQWRARLDGSTVDPRMKDLLRLAGTPNSLRPLASATMRLTGQPHLAHTLRSTGRASADRMASLMRSRDDYRRRFAAAMDQAGVDVLICPPCAVPAFRHGATRDLGPASVSYTCLFNLLAYPAGVVTTTEVRPGETSARPRSREKMMEAARLTDEGSEGLPIGVQVVGRPSGEEQVLAVLEELERSSTWRR